MKILIVLTSYDRLGATGEKTGFWLEEFAAPYYAFKHAGAHVTLASPLGGQPPIDPKSEAQNYATESTRRFKSDADAQAQLADTVKLSQLQASQFDAVFYPGGHGPVWDLAENRHSISLIESMFAAEKPIGTVCHAAAVLRHAKATDGLALVRQRKVTGFSNSEEEAVGLSKVVPYLVEDMLRSNGGIYTRADDWQPCVAIDGNLVTGQNPASSTGAAEAVIKLIRQSGQ